MEYLIEFSDHYANISLMLLALVIYFYGQPNKIVKVILVVVSIGNLIDEIAPLTTSPLFMFIGNILSYISFPVMLLFVGAYYEKVMRNWKLID